MAYFTEKQIQQMMGSLKWDCGVENNTRELAILELEDLKRKGCTLEHIGECHGCSASTKENSYCPMWDWEKRHPEYVNDELAMKIKILEAGGEEAYRAKLEAQENAKKKAEEEAKNEAETIKIASELKEMIITDSKSYSYDNADVLLERYVQLRINLALKYGKITIA